MYGLGRESLLGQLRYGFFQLVKIRQLNTKVSSVQTERINCFKKPRNVTNVCTVVVWGGGGGVVRGTNLPPPPITIQSSVKFRDCACAELYFRQFSTNHFQTWPATLLILRRSFPLKVEKTVEGFYIGFCKIKILFSYWMRFNLMLTSSPKCRRIMSGMNVISKLIHE